MSEEDFRKLYVYLVESCGLSPETARDLLQRILIILNENRGAKQEK